jgi:hypothetical protein
MQIHIVYLPLVFFLGMTYEYWRRRRLNRRRLAIMVDVLRKTGQPKNARVRASEQDPTSAQS